MSIYVRPFKKEDLDAFEPTEPIPNTELCNQELGVAVEDYGMSVTGMADGKIIGCGGVLPTDNENIGEVWLRLNKDYTGHKIAIVRLLKSGMKIFEKDYPFSQLRASVRCCFGPGLKLVEHLGFRKIEEVDYEGNQWFIYAKGTV